jgi:hypothetical protein
VRIFCSSTPKKKQCEGEFGCEDILPAPVKISVSLRLSVKKGLNNCNAHS